MSSRTKSNPFTALQGVSLSKSLLELHKKRSLTERDLVKDGPKSRPSSSRKSSSVTLTEQTEQIHSSQVIIHVYDEARGLQRDFYCEKSLLASQMKYFSSLIQEKTVDIDVHSDLKVFERLMGYCIHKEIHLNVGNVVSILISCHFLQMEQLELQCLDFMVFNMEKVLEAPIDFGCIHRTLVEK
jgi:hypothetical protein